MRIKLIIVVARFILRLIAKVELIDFDTLPETGGVVVVSNHLGRLDAILGFLLTKRKDVIMMIAEKYQKNPFWNWFGMQLDAIWLNRYEADFHAMRQVYQRLRQGHMLAIAPEGTRSETEALILGKPGAVYLAAKAGVPMYPIALTGTEDRVVKARLKRFQRVNIVVRVGKPYLLPPMDRKNRDVYLQEQTDEIMCRIAALLPPTYRGVYADHPRLQELLAEQAGTE
jgi:1-acyl-sn-glycerol-3-phosphate acyltransferase